MVLLVPWCVGFCQALNVNVVLDGAYYIKDCFRVWSLDRETVYVVE